MSKNDRLLQVRRRLAVSLITCAAFEEFKGDYSLPVGAAKLMPQPDHKQLRVAALSTTGNKPTGLADPHLSKIMQWLRASVGGDVLAHAVTNVDLVFNENHASAFYISIRNLLGRINSPAFKTTLREAEDEDEMRKQSQSVMTERLARRQQVLDHLLTLTRQVSHAHSAQGINIVRAWHGTSKKIADSVIRNGFAALATLDAGMWFRVVSRCRSYLCPCAGWFGKGIYFTSSPQYALAMPRITRTPASCSATCSFPARILLSKKTPLAYKTHTISAFMARAPTASFSATMHESARVKKDPTAWISGLLLHRNLDANKTMRPLTSSAFSKRRTFCPKRSSI